MPQPLPEFPEDPFRGLLLPMQAWRAIDDAHITSLEQLKGLTALINQLPNIDPEVAQIIKDRLARLAARRTVRVRLVFPKWAPHQTKRQKAQGSRRSPAGSSNRL